MQSQYTTPREIYAFLQQQKAPERLIKHHKLVVEATEEIITDLKTNFPNLDCNYSQVLIGAAIHDAGKIIFNNEIYKSGNRHELEGEQYLINLGIPPHIAKFCRTHAHWNDPDNTIEDLLVAVADVLWKGCRNEQLENLVISRISNLMEKDFWDVFLIVDSLFEKVSDCGIDRLNRSLSF
ncbi:HD domain-containing protein [Hyella patelloides LEGE 07179]|uniref:HD domain-containing protein n=1 Tax=Hyella patelloides LEGE 07179 TaxID=945734 RepID=A0A563W567_9CYAN|nr:HD domain-containing protein [Hyella patelloides]VEP18818.1 HD domain-containing protein [Hyella patelloides LEGE 07179]